MAQVWKWPEDTETSSRSEWKPGGRAGAPWSAEAGRVRAIRIRSRYMGRWGWWKREEGGIRLGTGRVLNWTGRSLRVGVRGLSQRGGEVL